MIFAKNDNSQFHVNLLLIRFVLCESNLEILYCHMSSASGNIRQLYCLQGD